MEIRQATEADLDEMMKIYEYARRFMAENGNPDQWGPTNWPPRHVIHNDILRERSFVCLYEEKIVGTFFYTYGKEAEPTYQHIEQGEWLDNGAYGVVHRIAGDGSVKGIGTFCLNWAYRQRGHLRIDTHGDNKVMQNLLVKLGFQYRGIIYVEEDHNPRLAYEKL